MTGARPTRRRAAPVALPALAPALALGLALGLALAGCTGTAAPVDDPSAASPTPSASWPTVPGRVLSSTSTSVGRMIRIAVRDPDQAYLDARALLVDAGFMLTKDRPGNGGGDGQACTPALCVSFDATRDPDLGPTLHYEAFRSTGVAPLD